MIREHSIINKHVVPNTHIVSTLPYPPKFATFLSPDNPKFPAHLTPETNMVNKIDEINKEIIAFNKENIRMRAGEFGEEEMFEIHKYGIRLQGGGKREHRWGSWFEQEDDRKLHFKHCLRAEILHRIQLYYIHNTHW